MMAKPFNFFVAVKTFKPYAVWGQRQNQNNGLNQKEAFRR